MVNLNWQPGMTLDAIEKESIKQAMVFFQGNKSAVSRALDISVRTLDAKLERYEGDARHAEERESERKFHHENFNRRSRGLAPLPGPVDPRDVVKPQQPVEAVTSESTDERLHVEPASQDGSQHGVPVPVRKEVQEMSSKSASGVRPNRAR